MHRSGTGLVLLVILLAAIPALADDLLGQGSASWMLQRSAWDETSITGVTPDEIDLTDGRRQFGTAGTGPSSGSGGLAILLSAIVPGAGEVSMGYKR